jgi:hypothetical protein
LFILSQAAKEQYWEKVLKPISERYNAIITRQDIKKIYNNDKTRIAITSIIESLIGEIINFSFENDVCITCYSYHFQKELSHKILSNCGTIYDL